MLTRSFMFVPGYSEKMLNKINGFDADNIIIDLEDAVLMNDKKNSRILIEKMFSTFEKNIYIRINSEPINSLKGDLKLIEALYHYNTLKGIVVPKAKPEIIQEIDTKIDYLSNHHNKNLIIIPLIEEAYGIFSLEKIIQSSERIKTLMFGAEDYRNDIRASATENEHELLFARSQIVLLSRVYNLMRPIDTVYTNTKNLEGFKEVVKYVKSLGFGGKLLIHPSQIEIANEVFSPTEEEINLSQEIIKTASGNTGAFSLHGKMIDKPIIENAKKILSFHEEIIRRGESDGI